MNRLSLATIIAVSAAVAVTAAQKTTPVHPGTGGSPHVRTGWTVEGADISIEYGRPYLKGRAIGTTIVPYGQVWRAGADEATTLKTDKDLTFGSVKVPAGTYTLWVLPTEKNWKLIINKQTGQWGTSYDGRQDLARVDMTVEKVAKPVEQHTFNITSRPGGGTLAIEWGTVKASVPFTVAK